MSATPVRRMSTEDAAPEPLADVVEVDLEAAASPELEAEEQRRRRRRRRLIALLLLVLIIATVLVVEYIDILTDVLLDFVDYMDGLGTAGALLLAAATFLTSWPGIVGLKVMLLAAGFLYGLGIGLLVAYPPTVLGSIGVFLVSRKFLPDRVEKRFKSPRWKQIYRAVRHKDNSLKLSVALYMALPFDLANILLGAAKVDLASFLPATLLGNCTLVPVWVWIGSTSRDIAKVATGSALGPVDLALIGVSLFFLIVVSVISYRMGKRVLDKAIDREEAAEASGAAAAMDELPVQADDGFRSLKRPSMTAAEVPEHPGVIPAVELK